MAGRAMRLFGAQHEPCFFKVIVHESLSEGKVMVPKKFVIKHAKDLPDLVVLKVRTGTEWQIGITKSDGQVWLENGWQEFADHYSLVYGCHVVFEYKDNSHFNVLIFDQKGMEIAYYPPRNSEEPGEQASANHSLNDGGADIPVNIGGDTTAAQRYRKPEAVGGQGHEPVSVNGEDTDVERDNAYEPKDASFKKVMRKTYIFSYFLVVPYEFARRHFEGNAGRVMLKVSDHGKTWPVNYKIKGIDAKLCGGWDNFVRHNNLEIGDLCVFKLVKDNEISLEVTISRCRKRRRCGESRIPSSEVVRELQNFTSKYPSFFIVLRPTHLDNCGRLILPFNFAKTHLKHGKRIPITLELENERRVKSSWKVMYSFHRSHKICAISFGWSRLAKLYSLKPGDGLACELIKSDVLKATIFRTRNSG